MNNFNDFLKFLQAECSAHDINLKIGKGYVIVSDYNDKASGYFCDETMTLAVSVTDNETNDFEVAIHEYNHMLQFLESADA
jgi:hypothetical protein